MDKPPNGLDRAKDFLLRWPPIVVIVLVFFIVAGLAAFTENLQKLWHFVHPPTTTAATTSPSAPSPTLPSPAKPPETTKGPETIKALIPPATHRLHQNTYAIDSFQKVRGEYIVAMTVTTDELTNTKGDDLVTVFGEETKLRFGPGRTIEHAEVLGGVFQINPDEDRVTYRRPRFSTDRTTHFDLHFYPRTFPDPDENAERASVILMVNDPRLRDGNAQHAITFDNITIDRK